MERSAWCWMMLLAGLLACAPARAPHLGPGPAPRNPHDRAVEKLIDRYLFDAFSIDPVDGSLRGDDRFVDRWPDTSSTAIQHSRLILKAHRRALHEIDRSALSPPFVLDAELMGAHIDSTAARLERRASGDAALVANTIFVGLATVIVDGGAPAGLQTRGRTIPTRVDGLHLRTPLTKLRAQARLSAARGILSDSGVDTGPIDALTKAVEALGQVTRRWPARDRERFVTDSGVDPSKLEAHVGRALEALANSDTLANSLGDPADQTTFDGEVDHLATLAGKTIAAPRVDALRPMVGEGPAVVVEAEAVRFVFRRLLRTLNRELLASKAKRHLRSASFDEAWVALGGRFVPVLADDAARADSNNVAAFERARILVGALLDAGLHASKMDDWSFAEWLAALTAKSGLPSSTIAGELELVELSPGFAFRRYLDYMALEARWEAEGAKTDPAAILHLLTGASSGGFN